MSRLISKPISTLAQKLRFLFVFGAFLVFAVSAPAQKTPEITKSDAPSQTFADCLAHTAAQNHIVIAAEDVPLRLTITDEEKQALIVSIKNLSLKKSIEAQAAFFDYEAQSSDDKVFVLRKKYTDPADLPYVSLDEAAHLLDVSNRFISRFKSPYKYGRFEEDPAFQKMLTSLTEKQLALMKENKLPMASLLPEQKQQMQNALVVLYIDDDALRSVEAAQFNLTTVRTQSDGGFHRFTSAEKNERTGNVPFGFVYPALDNNYAKTAVVPLYVEAHGQENSPVAVQGGRILSLNDNGNKANLAAHDATQPTEADREAAKQQAVTHASPTVITLKTLAERLTQKAQGKTLFAVDDALQSNPVSLFGAEDADVEAVFIACAAAYDLRVTREKQSGVSVLRLVSPFIARPNRLADLPSTLRRTLPGPYVRALHLPEMNEVFADVDAKNAQYKKNEDVREARRARGEVVTEPTKTEAEKKARRKENEKADAVWKRWSHSPNTLEQAALRRLRATVEPKADAAPDKKLPLSALSDTEKAALTTALMRIALDGLQNFCLSHPPVYIDKFGELMLSGGPYMDEDEKKPMIEIGFGILKADGSYDQQAGFGHIPYQKPQP